MDEKLTKSEAIRLTKEIEKKFSLEKYLVEAGIDFKQSGSNRLMCCCPLHEEKSPSFVLYRDSNSFCCFGACHVAGGVVKFVKLHKKWGWYKTVKYLNHKYHICIGL